MHHLWRYVSSVPHQDLEINNNQDEPLMGTMWISGLGHHTVQRQEGALVILYSTYKKQAELSSVQITVHRV